MLPSVTSASRICCNKISGELNAPRTFLLLAPSDLSNTQPTTLVLGGSHISQSFTLLLEITIDSLCEPCQNIWLLRNKNMCRFVNDIRPAKNSTNVASRHTNNFQLWIRPVVMVASSCDNRHQFLRMTNFVEQSPNQSGRQMVMV